MAVPHFILVPYDIDKITLGFTIVGPVWCFANSERIDLRTFYCIKILCLVVMPTVSLSGALFSS